ncbi:MAG: hypothetical protein IKZ04_04740, partial [Spirochaetaceae bacterium]|nr:hypothetical protein [Spirochaetaceae bacterium]
MEFDSVQENTGNTHEKSSDLDRYGVWVKKPPRTIHDNDETQDVPETVALDSLPDFDSLEEQLTVDESSNDFFETDLELDTLPDFSEEILP